jgi:hypothetical protein
MASKYRKSGCNQHFFHLRFRLVTAMSGMTVRLGQSLSRDRDWIVFAAWPGRATKL